MDARSLPLFGEWTWFAHCSATKYSDTCIELGRFSTVHDFWCHHHHIPKVKQFTTSLVKCKGNALYGYSVFRDGVKPEWEDPVNAVGGEFVMRVDSSTDVDSFWKLLLLSCVGGSAPLVGVRCIAKHPMKFEAWYSDAKAEEVKEWIDSAVEGTGVRVASHKKHASMQGM